MRGLLVADYALPQVLSVLSQLPDMRVVYVLHTGEEGWDCLNTCLEGPDVRLPHIAGEANQTLEIMYTSGTTGSPRGVLLDNRRILEFRALGKLIFGYRPDDRLYTGLSLAHGNAQAVTLMGALGQGSKPSSRAYSPSNICGTSPVPMDHGLFPARWHGHGHLQRTRAPQRWR